MLVFLEGKRFLPDVGCSSYFPPKTTSPRLSDDPRVQNLESHQWRTSSFGGGHQNVKCKLMGIWGENPHATLPTLLSRIMKPPPAFFHWLYRPQNQGFFFHRESHDEPLYSLPGFWRCSSYLSADSWPKLGEPQFDRKLRTATPETLVVAEKIPGN